MASGYKVSIGNIATDGINLFLTVSISDGKTTMPPIHPIFPVETTASAITTYIQNIANNLPVLDPAIAALVGTSVTA